MSKQPSVACITKDMLVRVDEKVAAVHEYIVNEIRPAIKELSGIKESIKWLKAGVFGVYGLFGSVLLAVVAYVMR
ncbi:MAG: hypothetical protein AB7V39_00470 [Nitrospiraceae bacterium]